jgi:hypothetical protein
MIAAYFMKANKPLLQISLSTSDSPSRKPIYILLTTLMMVLLVAIGLTNYIVVTRKTSISQVTNNHQTVAAKPTNTRTVLGAATSDQTAELNGFPVYANATFITKDVTSPCQNGMQFGGTITCGSNSYVWTTPDDFNKVTDWYKQAGWCVGATIYNGQGNPLSTNTVCNKNGFVYGTAFQGNSGKTTIILYIPTK